ncbi:hypothetical protein HF290_04780 [Acidithiobacillus ferrooxidans]|uniref:hypothetical protein n=1 Tax=Acidithiobacillus ferrooxidans TaxID=920 RepID=UPI001C065C8D|nr:hypothetical protein [Acidithiobacillus ferrooxidans]MBU2859747.1 hypothetical protein [Acidithiobacillus ferrooxidans]
MDIFEDLLKNTTGFPPDVMKDLRDNAETLQIMSGLSKFDLQQETQHVLDHLPELREQRARQVDLEAAKEKNPELREQRKQEAARLHRAAEKLAVPTVDEQFKRRAAVVELSIQLKAHLREAVKVQPDIDPVRLKRFNVALGAVADSLPVDVGTKAEREQMARMTFVQELRDAGGDTDLAVDNFYKAAFADRERGHWNDIGAEVEPGEESVAESLDAAGLGDGNPVLHGLATHGPLGEWVERQDRREHLEQVAANRLLQAMPRLAAEQLNEKQYAAYRVMVDNDHLIDWKIDKNGKIRFKATELDASDDSNTVGKILQRELDYHTIRGATLLVTETVGKLNTLLREHDGQEVALTEKGRERLAKSTQEVLADPAAQARNPYKKDKGKGGPGL